MNNNNQNGLALLRETLGTQAQTVTLPAGLTDSVRARARRAAVRRRVAAVAAAVAVMTGAGVTVAQVRTTPEVPGVSVASLLPTWPERGASARDTAFVDAALGAWNASTGDRHTLRKVLFAGRDSLGPVALLLATDSSGHLRLGGIVGAAGAGATPSQVIEDRQVTNPIAAASLVHRGGGEYSVLIFVTDQSMTSISWTAGGMAESDSLASGFDVLTFDASYQVPTAVTVIGPDGPHFVTQIG